MTAPESWVWLARIRRSQGRKGEVFAEILTDFPEKFAERRHLWLVSETVDKGTDRNPHINPAGASAPEGFPRSVELVHHWLHKGGIVLHFAGIDSISSAEALIGLGVAIPLAGRATLAPDEAYIGDLIGCTLIDLTPTQPVTVGTIEDVDRTAGPAPLLIVEGTSGEVLVPFAKSYLRRLDLDARRVEMALPEGLTSLNKS